MKKLSVNELEYQRSSVQVAIKHLAKAMNLMLQRSRELGLEARILTTRQRIAVKLIKRGDDENQS